MHSNLPDILSSVEQLEAVMSTPCSELIGMMERLDGDILLLGAGGKMGPTLAMLAARSCDLAGKDRNIIAVSRFSDRSIPGKLEARGVTILECDLLERDALASLPDARNVIFLAGRKFGSTGNEPLTWVMNTHLPGKVMERFRYSRIVVLSTGNVYPFVPVSSGGSTESDMPEPVGEYAQSCLGRERLIQYWSVANRTPACIIRLNYAIDLRYGVLLDIARKVWAGLPVDLRMGHVNVIWQGDANTAILMALERCSAPADVLNVTGQDTRSVREIALRFGVIFGREVLLDGEESATALLSNAERFHREIRFHRLPLDRMIGWTAHWIMTDGVTYLKPTHFEERRGRY